MNKIILSGLVVLLSSTVHANQHLVQAKQNFEQHCVRDLPQPILNAKSLQQHQFKLLPAADRISTAVGGSNDLIMAHEQGRLADQSLLQVKQDGCEFINTEVTLQLAASKIEQQGKLCQSCLINTLKQYQRYFKQDQQEVYLLGIERLEHGLKGKKLQVKYDYSLDADSEISSTTRVEALVKNPKNQTWTITLLMSVGPL